MNNLMDWFGSGLKIKRWLFLVVVGTFLLSYGISNLKLATELNFQSILVTGILFVIGITLIVFGFLMSQRRILKAVAESNVSLNTRNLNIKKLILDKKTLDKSVKIVTIGNGDGMSALLDGMKLFSNNITAIISTLEDRSSNLEVAEIKRAMVALAENNKQELEKFMNHRLTSGKDVGETILDTMADIYDGNYARAIYETSNVLAITGKVLPATLDRVSISAVLSDGTRLHGKDEILKRSSKMPIEKVALVPERCTAAPNVLKSIKEADLIIIGPGSLYTGIMPILLIKEIANEIRKSKATKIFVSNIMTEPGQTDNFSLSDHINVLHEHAGKGIIDYCVASDSDIIPEYIRMYNTHNSDVIDIDKTKMKNTDVRLVVEDMSIIDDKKKIRHDSIKLAKVIIDIMCQNMDLSANGQALEYYNIRSKLKGLSAKNKKKSVLLRDVKVISKNKNNKV